MEPGGGDLGEFTCGKRWVSVGVFDTRQIVFNSLRSTASLEPTGSVAGSPVGLRPQYRPLSLGAFVDLALSGFERSFDQYIRTAFSTVPWTRGFAVCFGISCAWGIRKASGVLLGVFLGRSWAVLGALGRVLGALGRSWAALGRLLGALGWLLGALGAAPGPLLGRLGRLLGALGRALGAQGRPKAAKTLEKSIFDPSEARNHVKPVCF